MYGHDGWMLGGGHVMLLWWLLPIAFVVALFIYFLSPSAGRGPAETTALDILRERYARGEIDREEFEQKKRDIGG